MHFHHASIGQCTYSKGDTCAGKEESCGAANLSNALKHNVVRGASFGNEGQVVVLLCVSYTPNDLSCKRLHGWNNIRSNIRLTLDLEFHDPHYSNAWKQFVG